LILEDAAGDPPLAPLHIGWVGDRVGVLLVGADIEDFHHVDAVLDIGLGEPGIMEQLLEVDRFDAAGDPFAGLEPRAGPWPRPPACRL